MTFIWEQNDRGGAAGTSLLNNTKTNGPLFAMFPIAGQISETDTLLYNSPGENHVTTDPTRVFPDLQQILDNNTNADTGTCPTGPIAPPVPIPVKECFMEFLPTPDYVGVTVGTFNNSNPLSLHFRFTARDGEGGVNSGDTTLLLANTAGPFLVTSHQGGQPINSGATETVTWNVAGTDVAPVSASNVKISLSVDGGHTYPYVLAASTPNDGSASVLIPALVDGAAAARFKVEAVGNVFFDLSNLDVHIKGAAEQLDDLLAKVIGVGPGKSLENKVRGMINDLDAGNVGEVCSMLTQGFPNEVRAQRGKKIPPALADQLLADAARIAFVLGC